MKIAILGPSPVPYTIGGMENLLAGMYTALNQHTPHQVELMKLPSKEHNFWDLIDTYYSFYTLNLDHFDMVICTKYPSWMIRHPNCVYYAEHCLRGLYDTYHFSGLPTEVQRGNAYIDAVLDEMEQNPFVKNLDHFFEMMFELRNHVSEIPPEYFAFPAPFIRLLVQYMDQCAMARNGYQQFYAISQTVADRKDYFPPDVPVKVIYPPSALQECVAKSYDYVFMVSRLDGAKRISKLIEAMRHVQSDVKLLIAGTGPESDNLKAMAKGDDRIEFLGFVPDAELEEYYANALVVPYFPYDEDYGLITIEAMMHKKAVITTHDAGGPTEFVTDYETGFVVDFDEKAIAEKIDYMATHRDEAQKMGENGFDLVKKITWKSLATQLMDSVAEDRAHADTKRPRATVVSTYGVYPPMGGGQARVFNLYKQLAQAGYDIEIVAAVQGTASRREIAPHLIENCVPVSPEYIDKLHALSKKLDMLAIDDIAAVLYPKRSPEYTRAVVNSIAKSDFVICCQPYLWNEVKDLVGDKPVVFESQNVESIMKRNMLPDSPYREDAVEAVFLAEKECCEKSEFIMACSDEDAQGLAKLYDIPAEKFLLVPNGVDITDVRYTDIKTRLKFKQENGLQYETLALFIGSWHGPNLDACLEILRMARQCPNVKFMLMGSQCLYLKQNHIPVPSNVGLLGMLSEAEKARVCSMVDVALNPMRGGSGTNLKIFDYMAAGIPVLTTAFGARGVNNDKTYLQADSTQDFIEVLNQFDLSQHATLVETARDHVSNTFDWSVIAQPLVKRLQEK